MELRLPNTESCLANVSPLPERLCRSSVSKVICDKKGAVKIPASFLCWALIVSSLGNVTSTVGRTYSTLRRSENPSTGNINPVVADYFQKVAGLGFSGAVLAVKDGRILLRDGYGWADEKRQIPNTPETIFDIGSITKVFTAVAIMQLEEKGKLKTSDPITKYFREVPSDKSAISLHHLLTHTSGLEHEDFYDRSPEEIRVILRDREKFIHRILSFPLAFKPGEKRLYSNSGFSFLAAIVAQLSGKSYEEYLRDNIFKPAGMTSTGYTLPNWNRHRVAHGYNDGPTDFGFPWTTQWSGKIIPWDLLGNGGLLSNVDDMYKFAIALAGPKLLSETTKNKMFTVYYRDRDQAYGWFVSKTEKGNHIFINHPGDAVPQGWNADFRWYKNDNFIAIVLTNKRIRAGSIRRYAMNDLADIVLFDKAPAMPDFATINAGQLRSLEGTYKLDSGEVLQVKAGIASTGGQKKKCILVIGGQGQRAIDLLFSGNQTAGLTKLSLDLNEKTKNYIEVLRKNDTVALKSILPEGTSSPDAVKSWNESISQRGPLITLEVLGTSPLNQSGVQTFLRLEFASGPAFYHVTWRDGKLHDQEEDALQPEFAPFLRKSFVVFPLNVPFLPKSATDFSTYDPFKRREIGISFENSQKLIFHTKTGDVSAGKTSK